MEIMQIELDNMQGTATCIESTPWQSLYKVQAGEKCLVFSHNYTQKETYTLKEYRNMDLYKAMEQMPLIAGQIYKHIMDNRPRPPKRYR